MRLRVVPSLPHSRHHIGIVGFRNREVYIFVTTVRLPDNVGVLLLNWHHCSAHSSTHCSRVDMIHPRIRAVECVDFHLLHHVGKAMIGRFLGGDAAELRDKMCHKRAGVG